jgi:hypothetical protein
MTEQNLHNIVKMRMAVYRAGVNAGLWKDVDQDGASDMMNYIFPKSSNIAYYNLVMEFMRKAHDVFSGSAFYLFKLPAQVEKMIMDYLKNTKVDLVSLGEDADAYLQSMDTIATNHCFTDVNIGSYHQEALDNLLRLCASHYRYSFQENVKSFPYMQ